VSRADATRCVTIRFLERNPQNPIAGYTRPASNIDGGFATIGSIADFELGRTPRAGRALQTPRPIVPHLQFVSWSLVHFGDDFEQRPKRTVGAHFPFGKAYI
jgi:hypothetical protein